MFASNHLHYNVRDGTRNVIKDLDLYSYFLCVHRYACESIAIGVNFFSIFFACFALDLDNSPTDINTTVQKLDFSPSFSFTQRMNFIFVHKIVIANAKLSARKKERTKRKNFNKEKIIVIDIEIEDRITQTKKKLLEKYHISRH